MPIIDKLKEEIKSLVLIGMGEDLAKINTKVDFLVADNQRITKEIDKMKDEQIEIYQRLSNLEGRFENLAQDTWLKVENQILKTKLLDNK